MPVYPIKCKCGHKEEVFRSISDHGTWPDHCGEKMTRYMTPTNVMEDMKEYVSPLDGSVVRSRKHHRDHMVKHDVIEMGNEKPKRTKRAEYSSVGLRDEISGAINDLNRISY